MGSSFCGQPRPPKVSLHPDFKARFAPKDRATCPNRQGWGGNGIVGAAHGECILIYKKKRKSAADRKAEIVETAIRLAADLGPDRVTTQHLADEVGLTQPAIFRHFATKVEIWTAVGEHIVDLLEPIAPAQSEDTANEDDPVATIEDAIGRLLHFMAQHPAVCAIMASRELQSANEHLRRKLSGLMTKRRRELSELITQAKASGVHRSDVVAEDAAALILAAVHGVGLRWQLEERGFDLVDEGQRLLEGLLAGLRS